MPTTIDPAFCYLGFGADGGEELTLEKIGTMYKVSPERIRRKAS
jgi:DNA-directed RNA polymerase sigma subunit (sigma70/sigma32)